MIDPSLTNPSQKIHPRQARREFLNSRKGEYKESTNRAYEYPTKHFVEFCEEHGINTTGEINNYVLESWKEARKKEDVKLITVHNNVKHTRVFIRWCERNELIEQGTADMMDIPNVTRSDTVSEVTLKLDHAEQVLRYLSTYEYATRQHALFFTMWHTGCRASGAVALDLEDFDPDLEDKGLLKFRNRPELGTPLKNRNSSERNVAISKKLRDVLVDYVEGRREDVTDDFDREPLFTTTTERVRRQRIYKNTVGYTRPCIASDHCPHNRDKSECKAAQKKTKAAGCPSSVSTHPIRRGSITYHLNRGWSKEKLSERVDVSVEVLEKHYDARTLQDKQESREQYLDLL